jgi:hypothetical protein
LFKKEIMAKINELVYSVRESIKEFSDDSEVDDRYIMYLYNIKRAKYLRQDLNNYQRSTDISIQQEFCMELEEVGSETCGIGVMCDKLMRTKQALPKAIELHTKPAILSIKPTNRLEAKFNVIPIQKVPAVAYSSFPNSIYAFIDTDNRVYMVSNDDSYKLLECITVTGVFENPLDLTDYKSCCGCDIEVSPCFNEAESEYPLQPHYIDLIREEIIRDLLRTKQVPEDKENDATS